MLSPVAVNVGSCFVCVFRGVSSTEFGDLEALCKGIMKDKQPFERLEISKKTLLQMFKVKSFPEPLIRTNG